MPKAHRPRSGSMQFWPRKRAKSQIARIRSWPSAKEAKALGFAGYKAGMTHVIYTDNGSNSLTKGLEVSIPVTVIECPPLKIFGIRAYSKKGNKLLSSSTILSSNSDKDLMRRLPKISSVKNKIDSLNAEELSEVRLIVHTQPRLTGMSKKKPEVFELAIGGKVDEQISYAKDHIGKDLNVSDIFSDSEHIDIHAVTKGKGFQGPVKRFGISMKVHKTEKSRRNPGSLGPWKGQGGILYRVAHAGQTGYHLRTEHNRWIVAVKDSPEEVNPAGGFKHYGNVKNPYILVKGSVPGSSKRLIRFSPVSRESKKAKKESVEIEMISTASKQGK